MRKETDSKYWIWIFYAGVLLALLPVMALRDFTPDNELRYLSIADESLRNHQFFAFYNHGLPYADKPPLYFWFTMLCRVIAGKHCMWLLALGSLLPAFGVIWVMNKWTAALMGRESRRASSLMLMTSGYFLGASVILRMDMLMSLFIVLSLYTFWKMREGSSKKRDRWLFPVYLFLALFTKGPLGILIPLLSIAAYLAINRELKTIWRYWGLRTWGVLTVLCVGWFLAVYADGGKDYLNNLLFHQTIDRAVDSFHHKRPIHYYLTAIWYIIAPWSLYVVGSLVAEMTRWKQIAPLGQFFITIAITTLAVLSSISSKLQIYLLPGLPFMVYGSMIMFARYKDSLAAKAAIGLPAAIFALILPALLIASHIGITEGYDTPPVYAAAAIMTLAGTAGLILLAKRGAYASIKATAIGLFGGLMTAGFALPHFNQYIGYGEICSKAKEICQQKGEDTIYVWKIKRPENMDVYLGREIRIIPEDSLPRAEEMGSSLLLVKSEDAHVVQGYETEKAGPYSVIIIDKR